MTETAPGVVAFLARRLHVRPRRTGPAGDTIVLGLDFDGARLVDVKAHPHLLDRAARRPATTGTPATARIAAGLANPCPPRPQPGAPA